MKKLILGVAATLLSASLAPTAFAATEQQNKMKECNDSAADKKGEIGRAHV